MTPSVSPDDRSQWLAARARVARRYHPDVGGDPDDFIAALAEVDDLYSRRARPKPGLATTVRRRIQAGRRTRRRAVRAVRSRLPRGLPGARRYIDL
ncbi:MAG: hypothetical protein ACK5MT_21085 [Actinomycetales bacterium]